MRHFAIAALLTLAAPLAAPLAAANAAAKDAPEPAFRPAVERAVEEVIRPGYAALAEAAGSTKAAVAALCEAPSQERLAAARQAFRALVAAFARVEPYRFGPARENNRYERLFFWPDPRGRGLRQVEGVILGEDESATTRESLQAKSVAVQGLPALDVILSGTGSDAMATPPASFRCRYARAAAEAIGATAGDIAAGWRDDDGFPRLMLEVGPDNPVYRSHGEAVQDLLQAGSEQIQIVRDLKLSPVLGDGPADARPRLAPFWRSGAALDAVAGNVEGVALLVEALDLARLVPDGGAGLASNLSFELEAAQRALTVDVPIAEAVADEETHARLSFALVPLASAIRILDERAPGALGLVSGFNSLDGD